MFQERKTRVQLEHNLNNQNNTNSTVPAKTRKRVKFACNKGNHVMNANDNHAVNVASVN